jgi:phage repressor protein C with HTH and peptisase S24 domain
MADSGQRDALERLIRERGEDYASLSRLIGRNPAYIQQFIKRGSPRRLDEKDRRLLARYFGVGEEMLGGPPSAGRDPLVKVPRLDVGASAGFGADAGAEARVGQIAFDPQWLRQLCPAGPDRLSFIRVRGDSMLPTLADGDEILVCHPAGGERLRDGIHVLRQDEAVMVKRLAINPATGRVTISSDNPAYPSWPDCELASLDVIGRVVWAGRKVA